MLSLRMLAILAMLAACAPQAGQPTVESLALPAGALKGADADAATCLSQGHPIGTDDYARCLLRLAEQRRAGVPAGADYKPEAPVKLGDWCYSIAAPEPFVCFDI